MDQFFAKDFTGGEFAFMGTAHLIALLSIVLFNFYLLRYKAKSESDRSKIRWTMAILLWANELGWHIWNASVGQWNIQTMIPLHVCSVLVWLGGVMLVTKNYTIYEFAYFMGIGGALQALLTPDLGIYGFPHYRFFQTFISHGLIVTSAIYMTTVEGFRPTWKSIRAHLRRHEHLSGSSSFSSTRPSAATTCSWPTSPKPPACWTRCPHGPGIFCGWKPSAC